MSPAPSAAGAWASSSTAGIARAAARPDIPAAEPTATGLANRPTYPMPITRASRKSLRWMGIPRRRLRRWPAAQDLILGGVHEPPPVLRMHLARGPIPVAGLRVARGQRQLRAPGHGWDGLLSFGVCLHVAQRSFHISLQPGLVLPLERPQVTDPPLKRLSLLDQGPHRLTVPFLSVPHHAVRTGPGIIGDLLSFAPCLGPDIVSPAASPAEQLIRLLAGISDRLIRRILRERENPGGGTDVVVPGRQRVLHPGHQPPLWLRGWCRCRDRRAEHLGWRHPSPAIHQVRPECFVFLDEPA